MNTSASISSARRYDIDALRVIVFGEKYADHKRRRSPNKREAAAEGIRASPTLCSATSLTVSSPSATNWTRQIGANRWTVHKARQ